MLSPVHSSELAVSWHVCTLYSCLKDKSVSILFLSLLVSLDDLNMKAIVA